MTDPVILARMEKLLARRHAAERRFRLLGLCAVVLSVSFLVLLLVIMLKNGISGIDWRFLTSSDSTDPVNAGIWGAFKGSLWTMLVTLALSFPLGVLAAVYLEEFAPRNRWVDIVEVSINNLAAVPSIIFGLLGLAVFINTLNMPRSSPLVGGLTLALMTMPVIVIASRNAIKAVAPSIRDAALAIGASPVQTVFQHVVPPALPGIMTGTIIGMARAWRDGAPADDRHARLYRHPARRRDRARQRVADADLPVVRRDRRGVCAEHLGGDYRPARLPAGDERAGDLSAQQVRGKVVVRWRRNPN